MLRAVALRFESGAITASSTPGTSSRAWRIAFRPVAVMPSSLVRRTLINGYLLRASSPQYPIERSPPRRSQPDPAAPDPLPGYSVAHRLKVEPVRRRGRPRFAPGTALQQPDECLRRRAEHRSDQHPDHVAHEGVGLDPEGEHVVRLIGPFCAKHLAPEARVIAVGWREGGEVVVAAQRGGARANGLGAERASTR